MTSMRIVNLETFLTNAGLRDYLFLRLTTDAGLTGLGEASLEWQEQTVQTLLHEWVEDRVLGADPFDVERLFGCGFDVPFPPRYNIAPGQPVPAVRQVEGDGPPGP